MSGDGSLKRWTEQHAGCACSQFTSYSIALGKDLVSRIENIVQEALPASYYVPTVVWSDNGDTDGSLACLSEREDTTIRMAKGSCVTWTTTLLAYVHALSHVLCGRIGELFHKEKNSDRPEKDSRHGAEWRQAVDWIESSLVNGAKGLDGEHAACIRASIAELKRMPSCIEKMLSAPAFLMEVQATCNCNDLPLAYITEIPIQNRRLAVNGGSVRCSYQDEFDAVDLSMQPNGIVEKGSLVELALELKRDHDPDCKCCSHRTYSILEVKYLVERLVRQVLPLQLPVTLENPPKVKCIVSSRIIKSYVDKRDVFCVNLNRIETFADAVRVVIREWARRFVVSRFHVRADVNSTGHYKRAVAGFSSLLIDSFPCEGLLNNWFASEDCLRLALIPAPLWVDGMVPLMRLSREGAAKVLADRTFDDVEAHDLDESRQVVLSAREGAMHSDIDGTMDMDEVADYMAARPHAVTESIAPTVHKFRLESACLRFACDFAVSGNETVAEFTHDAILKMARARNVSDNPSAYGVTFNGELLDEAELAVDVFKVCRTIKVEPVIFRKSVLKGWSSEAFEPVRVSGAVRAKELLEILNVPTPELACVVVDRLYEVSGDQPIDVTGELRVFSAGYAVIWATLEVGHLSLRDKIFVDGNDTRKPLKEHLDRWQRIYGIVGDVYCEGTALNSSDSLEDRFHQNLQANNDDGPLRITIPEWKTDGDVRLHRIDVKDSEGKVLGALKVRGHHVIGSAIDKFCKFMKMSPETVQMMTADGRVVSRHSRIYELFLDHEPPELVFTRKDQPRRVSRKRLRPSKAGDHGKGKPRLSGRFAHPRPSTSYVITSSDSEDGEDFAQ